MSFEIGQMVFLVSNATQKIYPAIIQEENHSKTIDGEHVTYKVLIGPLNSPNSKVVPTDQIDGQIYASLDDVRVDLLKNVEAALNEKCEEAMQIVKKWYGNLEQPGQQVASRDPNGKIDPAALVNEINENYSNHHQHETQDQVIHINGNQAVQVNGPRQPVDYQQTRRKVMEKMTGDPNRQLIQLPDGTLKEVAPGNKQQ